MLPTFVLIHGAGHRGACWIKLIQSLGRLGAPAVGPDLPCDDPHAGLGEYAEAVNSFIAPLGDDLVLVGHSMGGSVAPIVASRRTVRAIVLLCAPGVLTTRASGVPHETEPRMFTSHAWAAASRGIDHGDGTGSLPPEVARALLYHDCAEADADWAISQLRPQAVRAGTEIAPIETWPEVPTRSIIARDDRVVSARWARSNHQARFGEVVELRGGHSPFLSRPDELAALLVRPFVS